MTVELRPMGVACNLACTYCYQEPMREAGNIKTKYDVAKMLEEADKTGQHFSLFGGEALLVPKEDLEKFWKYGYYKWRSNSVQTNGTLIDDDHIELFKKYNVGVGISIDGWGKLNNLRVTRTKKYTTEEMTQKTLDNIVKLLENGIGVSVILTLHKLNGSKERLPELLKFLKWLGDIGVSYGNIHTLEVDNSLTAELYCLSQEENIYAFRTLAEFFEENTDLNFLPFRDYASLLTGDNSQAICTWNKCDPLNTQAVYGVEGNGDLSNCGRTNKEGIDWYKADDNAYHRYISLYNFPHEQGGCQGCRFFTMCGGNCPGESINGDFRNKSIHCETYFSLFEYYEQKLEALGITPISKHPYRIEMENYLIQQMANGRLPSLNEVVNTIEERYSRNRWVNRDEETLVVVPVE
jgi:uncharacterized protein